MTMTMRVSASVAVSVAMPVAVASMRTAAVPGGWFGGRPLGLGLFGEPSVGHDGCPGGQCRFDR
jgi:hypothetical protein